MINGLHRLMHLKTWFSVAGTVWGRDRAMETLGVGALLEEVCPWGRLWGL